MVRLSTSSMQDTSRRLSDTASDGLDALGETVRDARDRAYGITSRLGDRASDIANRGVDMLSDTRAQLRDRTQRATDASVRYVQDEPVKAILIAAAAGALLAAAVALLTRDSSAARSRMFR